MTIRTDTELDKQILDALEDDRAHLDRFAMTPNRHLLGALVGPTATAAGLWSLAATKLVTFVAAAALIGGGLYFVSRPTEVAQVKQVQSAPGQVRQAAPQSISVASREHAADVKHKSIAVAKTSLPTAPIAKTNITETKTPDIDHWNTGDPQQVQLPTKLEIETKAK